MQIDSRSKWGTYAPSKVEFVILFLISILPVNFLTKRIGFLLRKPIKNSHKILYDVSIWGLKLRLFSKSNLTELRWLTMTNFHDRKERNFINKHLSNGGIFFDIGANAGFYSFFVLSNKSKSNRVLAVEANPEMIERIDFNAKQNNLQKRLDLLSCAVTPQNGEVSIVFNQQNLGETKVKEKGFGVTVDGVTIIEILKKHKIPRVEFLKIDIEGNEKKVLESYFKNIKRKNFPSYIICEIFGKRGGLLKEFLEVWGYSLCDASKMNGMFILIDETN